MSRLPIVEKKTSITVDAIIDLSKHPLQKHFLETQEPVDFEFRFDDSEMDVTIYDTALSTDNDKLFLSLLVDFDICDDSPKGYVESVVGFVTGQKTLRLREDHDQDRHEEIETRWYFQIVDKEGD